jgi:peptidoglycan/xylan/chitin deacetylase (PgdA/CDA1 family)
MKAFIALKSMFACSFYMMGGMAWTLRTAAPYSFIILMYHRVIPDQEVRKGVQAGMYVTPKTFEYHIRFLKKYFHLVPIFEVLSNIERPHVKPLCVLTFDDGWYDFFTYAFPILKSHQVSVTAFLSTNFIGTENWFWTDRLSFLFHQQYNSKHHETMDQVAINPLVNKLLSLKGSLESRLEVGIELLKSYPNEEVERAIIELSSIWGLKANPPGRAFLSWEETREMVQSGLVTVGSHTATHGVLTTLEEGEIWDELRKSKEKLIAEEVVDPSFIPFSYPNGNYNGRIAAMVKDAGYKLAVTTKKGWNHNGSDLFALRRVSIHQDMTATEAMLGCRILGIF